MAAEMDEIVYEPLPEKEAGKLPRIPTSLLKLAEYSDDSDNETTSLMSNKKERFPRYNWILGGMRKGETISPHRAIPTLAKGMLGAGSLSLPYAWYLGGLWMSFAIHIFIAGVNWYGSHVMARCAQRLALLTKRPTLDYGHLAKKACEVSEWEWLQRQGNTMMYIVYASNVMVQLGVCTTHIIFVATNLQFWQIDMTWCCVITWLSCWILNLFSSIKMVSLIAFWAVFFYVCGTIIIIIYCVKIPTKWQELPAATNFQQTMTAVGMIMYTFEGQQLVLPIENKLKDPNDFLYNFGVLPTTMSLCSILMIALSFYGYTTFGYHTQTTITLNLPVEFSAVNVLFMLTFVTGHAVNMYAIYSMLWSGFDRAVVRSYRFTREHPLFIEKLFRSCWVFVTFILAVSIPKLDVVVPFVGATVGTLCAVIFPISIEIIVFMPYWRQTRDDWQFAGKLTKKIALLFLGGFIIVTGIYANTIEAMKAFSKDDNVYPT